jgi:hypothetical protein
VRPTVIILSLAGESATAAACGLGADGCCGSSTGTCQSVAPRVPVLICRDALREGGSEVELVTAASDAEIDSVIARLDGPPRPDGLTWPGAAGTAPTLVVAVESDGQLRAVLRRMVRRYTPPPSRRPADLAASRTLPDLPPIGVLPLDARSAPRASGPVPDLAERLNLPRDPAAVAAAVLGGATRRLDLFRTDAGSVTLHGALLGGVDGDGHAAGWYGRVEVDGTVLTDGQEPVLACAVANADGYARLDELALAPHADASSGTMTVAVAVPVMVAPRRRPLLPSSRRPELRIEVRRATGRAVSVSPAAALPYADDGVAGTLTRKRAWWVEPGAWAAFTG